jgi:muramidase (phage lysozyme)
MKSYTAPIVVALGLFVTPVVDALMYTVSSLVPTAIGNLGFMSPVMGQSSPPTKRQLDALDTYNDAVRAFESILSQRRTQISSNLRLLIGQKHLRLSAKFSMRCGSIMPNSNERCSRSTS